MNAREKSSLVLFPFWSHFFRNDVREKGDILKQLEKVWRKFGGLFSFPVSK